jgi:CHAD domain-containing protein
MKYTIQSDEPVSDGIKQIIQEKIETGIDHIDGDMDSHETVHEVRKRCKEVRAALRLVRGVLPTYSEENAHYRDAARKISDIRDATALIETFDDHVTVAAEEVGIDDDDLSSCRDSLVQRRDRKAEQIDLDERLTSVREDLVEGLERVDYLPITTEGYDAVSGGLGKSYRRGRNRMVDAYKDPTDETFHEWRKRIKYHRYHTRLLRSVWPDPMKARRSELKTLSDLIGDEHDLAVFLERMYDEQLFTEDIRVELDTAITYRRSVLQRRGRPIGERIFAEEPDQLVDRIGDYWTATREYDSLSEDL